MNPNTFLAELKIEGNPITKSGYTEDNFSLWVEKAEKSPLGKQLYYISCKAIGAKEGDETRYYLAASDTFRRTCRIHFRESVKTMENSPALCIQDGRGWYFIIWKTRVSSKWMMLNLMSVW